MIDQPGSLLCSLRAFRLLRARTTLPLYLPPYSPELNPVELIWKYIRQHHFNNHTFSDHEAVDDELSNALLNLYKHKPIVKSLTGFNWIIYQN
jgi:transposase